ncbi:MAG TPA: histidine kinase dimerization/phosphoacceptor domain -containing protein [Flavobacteriales bacterium]|nr:histidine kinase dimerization/phosphoacceptor domain -containing protein [Flavobacteriales bacterium]
MNTNILELQKRIAELEAENKALREGYHTHIIGKTVSVPKQFEKLFNLAEKTVGEYFTRINLKPSEGTITINEERYVLVRASALSYEFFHKIMDLYSDRGETEAIAIGKNFLFDIAHVLGIEDAKNFNAKMGITDPVAKLSAGPVHFAYSGWAFVDILPESNPSPDDNYYLKYHHPYSFEAASWIKTGKKSTFPVCAMNAGYSSGWCEESFGQSLTAVEVSCRAKGDDNCTFIMAPPHKIHEYLTKEQQQGNNSTVYDVPMFFERKKAEEKIKASLLEKEVLLKEIHHRVKNNLQIISSLLKLQSAFLDDPRLNSILQSSQQRIKTMAIVHEKLYQSDLQFVNVASYVRSIAQMSHETFTDTNKEIKFEFDFSSAEVFFKIDKAIACGLIVNEIITNAFKYAFAGRDTGTIAISLTRGVNNFNITISDNGIGLPESIDLGNSKSLGFELVEILSKQIEACIEVDRSSGTRYSITVPLD